MRIRKWEALFSAALLTACSAGNDAPKTATDPQVAQSRARESARAPLPPAELAPSAAPATSATSVTSAVPTSAPTARSPIPIETIQCPTTQPSKGAECRAEEQRCVYYLQAGPTRVDCVCEHKYPPNAELPLSLMLGWQCSSLHYIEH